MERKDISVIKYPEEGVTAANAEKVVEFIEMADQWRKRLYKSTLSSIEISCFPTDLNMGFMRNRKGPLRMWKLWSMC